MSIETTNDLFEMNEYVSDEEVTAVSQQAQRLGNAGSRRNLSRCSSSRLAGKRRSGRRPDFDASLTTLRVLNAFDQEKQAALMAATALMRRVTRREVDAVDLRVGLLLRETRARDTDNPFSPDYLVDAIGVTSRELYPNPRVWRPLMERVLGDVTPGLNKVYIRRQPFPRRAPRPAGDQGRAARAKRVAPGQRCGAAACVPAPVQGSGTQRRRRAAGIEHRRAFGIAIAIERSRAVPPPLAATSTSAVARTCGGQAVAPATPASAATPGSVAAAAIVAGAPSPSSHRSCRSIRTWSTSRSPSPLPSRAAPSAGAAGLPQLDPMLALGSLSTAVAALDRWQRTDPGGRLSRSAGDACG